LLNWMYGLKPVPFKALYTKSDQGAQAEKQPQVLRLPSLRYGRSG
jgi:hypothetical protein